MAKADTLITSARNTFYRAKITFTMPPRTKKDRKAEADAESINNAYGAIKASRNLYAAQFIKPFESIASKWRKRIASFAVLIGEDQCIHKEYIMQVMEEYQDECLPEWNHQKVIFGNHYAEILRQSQHEQGDLFDPTIYPDVAQVIDQFTCTLDIRPLGTVQTEMFDGLETAIADEVAESMKATIMRDIENSLRKPVETLMENLMNVHQKLSKSINTPEGVKATPLYESLMLNLEDIANMMPALNVTNSAFLNDIAAKARRLIVPIETLRVSQTAREETAEKAEALLTELNVNTDNNKNANDIKDRREAAKASAEAILAQMKGMF
jgi:valyl-tRNA synthetase